MTTLGGGNMFGIAGAAPLPESRNDAVRDEARAAERANAKAEVRQAEATTTDQLTRTDFTNTLRALKSLNLTRSEQNTLRTVLSTILPPEIRSQETGLENRGEGESAQAFTPDAPEAAADAPDVPSDHYVPEDAPSTESTQTGAHGDEAQDAAVARGDRKLYGTNPESKLDQALAKALPTAEAQHRFAEALRNPAANAEFLAQSLQQKLTVQDKGAALLELMSLAKTLRFALSRPNLSPREAQLLAKALGQAIALGQALTRGMEKVPDGVRQLFGQTIPSGGGEGSESGVRIFSYSNAQQADQAEAYENCVASQANWRQFCANTAVTRPAAQVMTQTASLPSSPSPSGAVPGQGGNRDDSTGRDRGTRGNKVSANDKRLGELRGSYVVVRG